MKTILIQQLRSLTNLSSTTWTFAQRKSPCHEWQALSSASNDEEENWILRVFWSLKFHFNFCAIFEIESLFHPLAFFVFFCRLRLSVEWIKKTSWNALQTHIQQKHQSWQKKIKISFSIRLFFFVLSSREKAKRKSRIYRARVRDMNNNRNHFQILLAQISSFETTKIFISEKLLNSIYFREHSINPQCSMHGSRYSTNSNNAESFGILIKSIQKIILGDEAMKIIEAILWKHSEWWGKKLEGASNVEEEATNLVELFFLLVLWEKSWCESQITGLTVWKLELLMPENSIDPTKLLKSKHLTINLFQTLTLMIDDSWLYFSHD